MAITNDSKLKRNDLPARSATRILDILFPPELRAQRDPVVEGYRSRLEKEITRAIWEETIRLEGEIVLGMGVSKP
jgi:hypothetical protein